MNVINAISVTMVWCMTAQIRGHKSKKSARDHIVTPRKHTQIDATTACHIMNVFFLCPKYTKVTRKQVRKFYFFYSFCIVEYKILEINFLWTHVLSGCGKWHSLVFEPRGRKGNLGGYRIGTGKVRRGTTGTRRCCAARPPPHP